MLENKMKNQKTEENKYMFHKLIPDDYLDLSGKIKEEFKYKINIPELKIKDSKFIPNPGDKFETMLFLPQNPHRKAEGGLRTKGFFKFSYKLVDGVWYICDLDGNPAIPAPEDLQNKIRLYVSSQSSPISYLPLITVITVVLNGEKTLEETIKSVISQTYPNVEYIIIDGGSTDGTLDIIKKYEDYIDYWVSEPDKGIYDAMNKGIVISFGEWLNMLNSGDLYYNSMVIENIYTKEIDTDVYGIAGSWVCDYEGNIFLYLPNPYKMLEKPGWHINHQAFFYRKITHKILGLYSTDYELTSDHEYFLRLLVNKLRITTHNSILIKFDLNQNLSDSVKSKWEDFLIRKKYLGFNLKGLIISFFTIFKLNIRKFLEKIGLKSVVILYRKRKNKRNQI